MRNVLNKVRSLPVTIRVPLLAAVFMIVVSAIVSQQVLQRLSTSQTEQLSDLTGAYLDGLSAAVTPYVLRNDIWEVFDALDRSRNRYKALRPLETIVSNTEGKIIASTNPRNLPSQSMLPQAYVGRFSNRQDLTIDADSGRAYLRRDLIYQNRKVGGIFSTLDVSYLMAERRSVLMELIFTNLVLTLLLAAIGYFAVRRMLKPIKILADHLEQGINSTVEPIPAGIVKHKNSEFGRLFQNYNSLVKVVREREALADRLAREERLASLGRLTSGMAHEINNPLGGLFNAVDTLKKHGSSATVRRTSLSLLERGLSGIRDVVSTALATYRPERDERNLQSKDIDDLALLLQPELRRRKLTLECNNLLGEDPPVNVAPIRQAILNLLLNAAAASSEGGKISLRAEIIQDILVIAVGDSGKGLPEPARLFLTGTNDGAVPVVDGSGIGLWMVQRLINEVGGTIEVGGSKFGGTLITTRINLQCQKQVIENAA